MGKKKSLKCIIAGSRSVWDYPVVVRAINESGWADDITEVVCGDANGVDKLGEKWANEHSIPVKHFPADWANIDVPDAIVRTNDKGSYNARAGFTRNVAMAKYADVLIAVIKDESSGTKHMIETMQSLDKKVSVWEI